MGGGYHRLGEAVPRQTARPGPTHALPSGALLLLPTLLAAPVPQCGCPGSDWGRAACPPSAPGLVGATSSAPELGPCASPHSARRAE